MATQLSPETLAQLFALRDALNAAAHGEQRRLVDDFAGCIGKSAHTVYTWLRNHAGYETSRKKRSDAGKTSLPSETLTAIAAMKREGVRGNGKKTMPTAVAMNIADQNGLEVNVSASRCNKLMKARLMDVDTLTASRNTIEMRTEFVNDWVYVDPSLCVLYYMGGKQRMMRDEEFYKNKLENFAKVQLKVLRYVAYEAASGSIVVRYFEAAGENQENLFQFLHYVMAKNPNRVCYGVMRTVGMDKGSANTSTGVRNWLTAMGVEIDTHATGHSWAKGGVEKSNDIVECHFESRLKVEPVENVDQLNHGAEMWARDYNANAIKHVDSRIRRASGEPMVRDALWQKIMRTPERLIEVPDIDVCRYFFVGKTDTRMVKNGKISFVHPEIKRSRSYDLNDWAESIYNGQTVKVVPMLLKGGAVRVEIERLGLDALKVEVLPETAFDEFGNSMSATLRGDYARAPKTASELAEQQLLGAVYGEGTTRDDADNLRAKQVKPFAEFNEGRGMVAHSHLGKEQLPTRLLPAATPLNTPAMDAARGSAVQYPPLSFAEFTKSMGGDWQPRFYSIVAQKYPDKRIPFNEVDALKEILMSRPVLKLVNGGLV